MGDMIDKKLDINNIKQGKSLVYITDMLLHIQQTMLGTTLCLKKKRPTF